MSSRTLSIFIGIVIGFLILFPNCHTDYDTTDDEFESLAEEIDHLANKYVKIGAVIGIIDKQQQRQIFIYGSKFLNTISPPDENTVFDIGSITKTFTATLLANRVVNGEIVLGEAVDNYLPTKKITLPTWDGTEIEFIHLVTHTSGIPRTPHEQGSDFPLIAEFDPYNPYLAYTADHIYDYLTNYCTLEFQPGTWWGYSNTGMGLLGHTLGLMDGTSYETILTWEIFRILGMNRSSVNLTEAQQNNLAQGYNSAYTEMPNYTANDVFQGAGHIKSCLKDMFLYLEAQMGLINTPLRNAIDMTHHPLMHQGSLGEQAMGWFILELDDGQSVTYSGGDTSGFSTYIGFNKNASTGAIILLNASFHNGTNLNMGATVLEAIMKY